MVSLVIVGAGGFGREILQYARDQLAGDLRVAGFLDDRSDALDGFDVDASVLGRPGEFSFTDEHRVSIAIGDPATRARLAELTAARGARFLTLVHPTAYVAPGARLGAGCVVAPFAFVGVGCVLAEHVALNTYASVGHDARVGTATVFSPYAVVNGGVTIEEEVLLGTHAVVTPGLTVGRGAKIAAGAIVSRAVPPYALAAGVPAQSRVMFRPR